MTTPVLVIHGIAVRDQREFAATVATMAGKINRPDLEFIPIFWGDLAASTTGFSDTVPHPQGVTASEDGRAGAVAVDPSIVQDLLQTDLPQTGLGTAGAQDTLPAVPAAVQKAIVLQAAQASAQDAVTISPEIQTQAIQSSLDRLWPRTRYLQFVRDPLVLRSVGQALDQGLNAVSPPVQDGADGAAPAIGANDIAPVSDGILTGIDNALGGAVGQALGRFNASLRANYGPAVAEGIGDIFVYQDPLKRAGIQARVRQGLPPGVGTPQNPVYIIAHSFGGLVALDMALSHEIPLAIKGLITMGSQPGFFQVLQPRPSLPAYAPGHPVSLPSTIGGWINLWEPQDALAFLVGPIFGLADGTQPKDVEVAHEPSFGLYTHGSYWTAPPALTNAVQTLFV